MTGHAALNYVNIRQRRAEIPSNADRAAGDFPLFCPDDYSVWLSASKEF